ncbi:hypothetical protein C8Q74DRAFT_357755 [Fomes fomentarius]|nr:hypothetical protein C8Q74DRAFT_357755 [Fomes fomentarius]
MMAVVMRAKAHRLPPSRESQVLGIMRDLACAMLRQSRRSAVPSPLMSWTLARDLDQDSALTSLSHLRQRTHSQSPVLHPYHICSQKSVRRKHELSMTSVIMLSPADRQSVATTYPHGERLKNKHTLPVPQGHLSSLSRTVCCPRALVRPEAERCWERRSFMAASWVSIRAYLVVQDLALRPHSIHLSRVPPALIASMFSSARSCLWHHTSSADRS